MDKWISVEDALPPALEDVLILFESGGYFRRRIVVGYWWGEPESSWGPAVARKFKVTHWMPMPKMPNALGEGRERGILREASSGEAATSTDGLGVAVPPAPTFENRKD